MIRFRPIYQKRVWGGRELETQFARQLPEADTPFGESWEISARDEADCVVISQGEWQGKRLTELWADADSRKKIFGENAPETDRFPLLCKILDARQKLSVQVHPPAELTGELGGEAKSETWFIAEADPGAEIYVGVRDGISRDEFESALKNGTVEDCIHRIPVSAGEHIFIPSGRLHAIGAGLVIYEIQENSDTTFRVYDWNRLGLDGKPRDLHVEESLKCIDFTDIEPTMDSAAGALLCECDFFRMERHDISGAADFSKAVADRFVIVTVINGKFGEAGKGDFFILSHGSEKPAGEGDVILTTWP